MKRPRNVIAVTVLVSLFVLTSTVHFAQSGSAWISLFDGKSLSAFDTTGNANWRIADGVVQADMGTGFLVTKNSYADFQLRVEFWTDDDANSGIFIRCQDPKQIGAGNAYEVNIFDKRPDQTYATGTIVDVAKSTTPMKAGGKWNTFEITAQGQHLVVIMNGVKTVDTEHKAYARGPVGLQYGAGTVKFRKVEIRPM